jgi:predicted DNA-binding transcriptional regulator AlpA
MSDLLQNIPEKSCALNSDPHEKPLSALVLDGFLRREQLAQLFGVSTRTTDRWEALRIGPPRVCVGRTILYSITSVREWLASREQQRLPSKRRLGKSGLKA